MRWSTYWHLSNDMLLSVLHVGKKYCDISSPSTTDGPFREMRMLRKMSKQICCLRLFHFVWKLGVSHRKKKQKNTGILALPSTHNELFKKVQSSKDKIKNLFWNALYHIRNDLIKLSTNQTKKSGKNYREKSDFKCIEIFKREGLGFVFCLVLTILCVH